MSVDREKRTFAVKVHGGRRPATVDICYCARPLFLEDHIELSHARRIRELPAEEGLQVF
jgi:hypothetical protein